MLSQELEEWWLEMGLNFEAMQKYEHDQQQLLIEFDKNDEQDALIWYNVLLKYVDKDDASAIAFVDYQQYLPVANQITLLQKKK